MAPPRGLIKIHVPHVPAWMAVDGEDVDPNDAEELAKRGVELVLPPSEGVIKVPDGPLPGTWEGEEPFKGGSAAAVSIKVGE